MTSYSNLIKGGIKTANVLHCLHGTVSSTGHALDGVAVVSEIVASPAPQEVSQRFAHTIRAFKSSSKDIFSSILSLSGRRYTSESIKRDVGVLLRAIRESSPMIHQVSNV